MSALRHRVFDAARLESLLKQRGLTPADVCRLAGIEKSIFTSIRSGRTRNPRFDTVAAIAWALSVRIEDFVLESPVPSSLSADLDDDESADDPTGAEDFRSVSDLREMVEIQRQMLAEIRAIRHHVAGDL